MHVLNNKEQLFALLAEGATVITPNNRLSDAITQQYFHTQNSNTVDKPICLPYGVALVKAYAQLNFTAPLETYPTLLNSNQCLYLWRKLIKSRADITYSEGLLQAVISAWERCELWQIASDDPSFQYTPQTRQFQQWWQSFNKELNKKNLIAECQLIPYLIDAHSPLLSGPVVWACFDDFTPQQSQLQQHLEHQGFPQYQYDLPTRVSNVKVLAANDEKEEYQQLISWLHLKIQEGSQRIGVVIPDLQQKSSAIRRLLAQHFDPAVFNVSLGQALNEFPLVAHALCWLNLDAQYVSAHQAALLLQSPYLGSAKEEFLARAEYLQNSVLLEDQNIPFAQFIKELQTYTPKLAALIGQIRAYPKEASLHDWIQLFQERLNILAFPGDYGLNSANYQCFSRFALLFDELRQLSLLCPHVTKTEALEMLGQLVENTIFQAQKTDSIIQISGLLEASGCEFDHLWMTGLTDQCLPQKVSLSAFIPPQLQRERHMPHSLPARELQFAKQTLNRLQQSANSVVFSYADLQGDTPNLPCSLITEHPAFIRLEQEAHPQQETQLINIEEHYLLPIKAEEQISGGTALLANQAKCPFKSFAEHRLRAKESSQTHDGLDAKTRGQIIHKVMELLWQKLQSQEALFTLDSASLEHHIDTAIHSALEPLSQLHPETFPELVRTVEYTRLKRLALSYLEWEKQRSPFTISALEQSFTINLAGLDFNVRVDRLDEVADKKWVIDYKSSLPSSRPWYEDRPKEPQLLLYALLDKEINALLLMQIKAGKIVCSGFSEEKQSVSGISSLKKEETWDDCRAHWHNQLTHLAQEFQEGHCAPQPAQLTICQQCSFQNLCRFQANPA
ncbi:PD-(D/E)XK nuclease family protein [Legionella lytica]|uniref:PD-(D/E)XK nuclease family protein n=1 Tax=Legionella lytica TaxID=96232 RepID=A0ABY4Y7E0_9GAMM|nr:PD-(D/E)XK nuclease family protein [Legionella lytica]USQ13382.1 PD-(D/E)XK nuclease family protein [Legionella lytica]